VLIFGGKDFDRNQLRPREDLLYWNLAGKNTRIWKSNFADIYAGALLLYRTIPHLFRANRTITEWHAESCCGRIHPRCDPQARRQRTPRRAHRRCVKIGFNRDEADVAAVAIAFTSFSSLFK
jgi:hypothetical protein